MKYDPFEALELLPQLATMSRTADIQKNPYMVMCCTLWMSTK